MVGLMAAVILAAFHCHKSLFCNWSKPCFRTDRVHGMAPLTVFVKKHPTTENHSFFRLY
jgi:hypothetical protein